MPAKSSNETVPPFSAPHTLIDKGHAMKRAVALIFLMHSGFFQVADAQAVQPKPPAYRIVPERDRRQVIAIALNQKGDLLAFRWMPEMGDENVLEQAPMLYRADTAAATRLPLLQGYTATMPADLSENGVVVGRASRPQYDNKGNRLPFPAVAFVWDEKTGIRSLGTLPDDAISQADAVSADGTVVSGISIGPNRVRACVWEKSGETWKATPLPQKTNLLDSNRVILSPSGKFAASVDGRMPTLWSRAADGTWSREAIGELDSLVPRAVNDEGTIAGLRLNLDKEGTRDAVIWSRKTGMKTIEKPPGYLFAELAAIDSRGVAVGFADGPHGSEIGPNACVTENGKLRIFASEPEFTMATAINDAGLIAGTFEEREDVEPGLEIQPPPKPRLLKKP